MNKFDAINKVMVSDLNPEDKCLLVELITRADDQWRCWPSVERLCKARGIKHEKNFKGADHYLPGLVTKVKRGRKNVYTINTPALEGLSEATVTIKHTNTPALEGVNTPAVADNTPAVEGANTTSNTTEDTSSIATAGAVPTTSLKKEQGKSRYSFKFKDDVDLSKLKGSTPVYLIDLGITTRDTPATEGVSEFESRTPKDWQEIRKQRPLTQEEHDFINARSRAYLEKQRAKEPVRVVCDW
jgi:hypothetical protein